MITEDYVSFEIAKLLKEKGFDGECRDYYNTEGHFYSEDFNSNWNDSRVEIIPIFTAPTLQMAMKWLREEKNIIVNVWYNGVDWNAEYYNNEDENFYLITDYSYDSYEDAVEAAIKYCLENLI